MKQRLFKSLLAVVALLPLSAWALETTTVDDATYYQIGTATELEEFAALVNAGSTDINAILTADIDMSSISNFTPIGDSSYYYTGTFDGDGHEISNLTISGSKGHLGLFYYTGSGAEIKNLGLKDVSITNTTTLYSCVAALVSYAKEAITLTNCYVDGGTITNNSTYTGGLIGGTASTATFTNCYNTATINSSKGYVGGLVGPIGGGATFTNCYNSGSVSGTSYVGGIFGYRSDITTVTLTKCYNSGSVSGSEYVGGLVGHSNNTNLYLTDCYNSGAVTASSQYAGGLVGYKNANSSSYSLKLTNCYNTGEVMGTNSQALVYIYSGSYYTITNTYYLSGQTSSYGTAASEEQFASGELCYLLNGISSENVTWYQEIGTDDCPTLTGTAIVYGIYGSCANTILGYTNTESTKPEDCEYDNGICPTCKQYQVAEADSDGVYQIANAGNLCWFAALVNGDNTYANFDSQNTGASAVLTDNIDMSNIDFTPIGYYSSSSDKAVYTGTFDGGGYEISNLTISGSTQYIGLFSYTGSGAKIKNLGLKDVSITNSSSYTGGLVGYAKEAITLTNCYVDGGTITATSNYVGGLIGSTYSTTTILENCYNSASVSGNSNVGGFAGGNNGDATFTNCYNSGSVSGSEYVGGLLGYKAPKIGISSLTLTNCYNIGEVTNSGSCTDGLVYIYEGKNYTFTNCYYLDSFTSSYGTSVTSDQVTSGELCYLLNGESSDNVNWYQDLSAEDNYPTLSGEAVVYAKGKYCVIDSYTNNIDEAGLGDHDYDYSTKKCRYCNADAPYDGYIDVAELSGTKTINTAGDYVVYGTNTSMGSSSCISITASGTVNLTLDSFTVAGYTNTTTGLIEVTGSGTCNITLKGESTFSGTKFVLYAGANATVNIDGEGSLTNTSDSGSNYYGLYSKGKVNINGGTITYNTTGNGAYGIYNYGGTLNINGGEVNINTTTEKACGIYNYNSGTTNINGGTTNFTTSGKQAFCLHNVSGGTMNISSDTKITAKTTGESGYFCQNYGTLNITGGTIDITTSGSNGRGIQNEGTMTINDCDLTFSAAGKSVALYTRSGATSTYNGGTYNITMKANTGRGLQAYNTGTQKISGGTFTIHTYGTDSPALFNESSSNTTTVTGGTFYLTTEGLGSYPINCKDGTMTIGDGVTITTTSTNTPAYYAGGTYTNKASMTSTLNIDDTQDYSYGYSWEASNVNYPRSQTANWATISLPYDCAVPEDVTAYGIDEVSDDLVLLTKVESLSANTGYLIYMEEPGEVDFNATSATVNASADCLTTATSTSTAFMPVFSSGKLAASDNIYKLVNTDANPYFNHSAGSATLAPFKSFLYVPESSSSAPQRLTISFGNDNDDDTTAIATALGLTTTPDAIYNLAGQKVETTTRKGLYIINGKKVVK